MQDSPEEALSIGALEGVSPEATREQLGKILKSERFALSARLSSLLTFVVNEYLEGNEATLKETVIATQLFGRPAEYDPQRDSIVRTNVNRLRAELAAYYEGEGTNDGLVITLPKGRYIPHFARREPSGTLLAHVQEPAGNSSAPSLSERSRLGVSSAIRIIGLCMALLALKGSRHVARDSRGTPRLARFFAAATSEGKSSKRLKIGYVIGKLIVSPDGGTLYAIQADGPEVTALGINDLVIKQRFHLPHAVSAAVISTNGKHLYAGSSDGVVMIANARNGDIEQSISAEGPVFDLAVTPDEERIFLAMGGSGLRRVLRRSETRSTLSEFACPMYLSMDGEGKRLFVSYQCGGPGGRDGHDVIEVYDATSERRIGLVRDLPMVGGRPIVSPGGDYLLLSALDACVTEKYDHLGCPPDVGQVYHLIRISDRSVVKTFTMPLGTFGEAFSADGGRLFFGGGQLVAMDWAKLAVMEAASVPDKTYGIFASNPTGTRTFVAARHRDADLLVFDAEKSECESSNQGLVNRYTGDGTFDDAVGTASLRQVGSISFKPGLDGQAFYFAGDGAFLEGIGGAACWPCAGNWTESFFAKFDSVDGEMTLLERGGSSANWHHRIYKTKGDRIALEAGNQFTSPILSSSSVEPNRWYHLALVRENEGMSFYLDGVSQGRFALPEAYPDPGLRGLVTLGAGRRNKVLFKGLIDEISWYGRAVTGSEVMSLSRARDRRNCQP